MSLDSTLALCTVEEAKTVLQISGSSEDSVIEDLINRASQFANTFTGRHLLQKTYTEYYDGDGSDVLVLRNYPVQSITSVHMDALREWGATSLISTDDQIQDLGAGTIQLWNNESIFHQDKKNVRVIYSAGYPSASIPHDLKDAVLMIVQHHYKRIYQDQRIGLASETIGDRTFTYSQDSIPAKAKKILGLYSPRLGMGVGAA